MAYEILRRNGIQTTAFVDSDEGKWGQHFLECEIISPAKLQEMVSECESILVQIASCYESEISKQLLEMGISDYVSYSELLLIPQLELYLMFESNPEFYKYYMEKVYRPPYVEVNDLWRHLIHSNENWKSTVVCCMPPKTGNCTLFHGGKKYCPSDVLYVDSWHSSVHVKEFFSMSNTSVKKIVTAVREPISQNLSFIFQTAASSLVDQSAFWEGDYEKLLEKVYKSEINEDNTRCMYSMIMEGNQMTPLIQNFFEKQFENRLGIRLYDYPFDKEAGYSLVNVDGLEIFIFQIEKLNTIHQELFDFIGLEPDAVLENMNVSDDKWYSQLYNETKETITFSQEYFDWSFNAPYLHHFHNDEDIEKFKKKWQGHVR